MGSNPTPSATTTPDRHDRPSHALHLFHTVVYDVFFGFGRPLAGCLALPVVCVLAEITWRTIESPLIGYARRRFARAEPVTIRVAGVV